MERRASNETNFASNQIDRTRTRVRRGVNAMLNIEHRHAMARRRGSQPAENAFINRVYRFETGTAGLQFNRLSRVCIKHVSRVVHVTRQNPLFNALAYTRAVSTLREPMTAVYASVTTGARSYKYSTPGDSLIRDRTVHSARDSGARAIYALQLLQNPLCPLSLSLFLVLSLNQSAETNRRVSLACYRRGTRANANRSGRRVDSKPGEIGEQN